jgi:hypothetical protein
MGIKGEKRSKPKGYIIHYNKIMENFPNLENKSSTQVQEACRTPNRLD